jgi:adenosylcobinamide amidohydrolase
MTAADVRSYSIAQVSHGDLCAHALATAGCSNLAAVGEEGKFLEGESRPTCAGTINLILVIDYRFTHEAMLEALAIATEAKVRAVYESGLRSVANGEPATGTGTDCIAVAVGSHRGYQFCGKHTKWGELIDRASLESVRGALCGEAPARTARSKRNADE